MTPAEAGFRFHPPLFLAVRQILEDVFLNHATLEQAFKKATRSNASLGSRDRKRIGAAAYEIVRFWRRYSYLAHVDEDLFSESSRQARIQCWVDEQQSIRHPISELPFPIRESWPQWYMDAAQGIIDPETWKGILHALNTTAPLDLRVNTLRYSVADVRDMLLETGISPTLIPGTDGLRMDTHLRLDVHAKYPDDAFEIQDAGSQIAGLSALAQPGMRILDACAGGGGKTLQLACIIQDRGYIFAGDASAKRLDGLRSRLKRLKYRSVHLRGANQSWPDEPFDIVFLDVPCTGTGTIRRQPERKYHVTPTEVARLVTLQRQIITEHIGRVAPRGVLVYVTCSILPDENEHQAAWISQHFPEYSLEFSRRLSPAQDGTDGFFIARFRRK